MALSFSFFHTRIASDAKSMALETLDSTFLSEGKRARKFEEALAAQLHLVRPVSVNSGTAALHLALAIAGVGRGDEVILPPQTFIATGMVVMMQGARPVFADIDPATGNLCPRALEGCLSKSTRAVIPVHWGGLPCDLDGISRFAKAHDLAVIEDAAHALGARYRGRPVGSVSRFTAFSFQAIKHVTTGDGGALCCLDREDEMAARTRRWFGIDRDNSKPSLLGERVYDASTLGYKYHMNDLAASLGIANLGDFRFVLERHRGIAEHYSSALSGRSGISPVSVSAEVAPAWWFYPCLVERREDFIRALTERGVPASVVHRRIDTNTVFGGPFDLPGQAAFDEAHCALPVHSAMTDENVDQVLEAIDKGW